MKVLLLFIALLLFGCTSSPDPVQEQQKIDNAKKLTDYYVWNDAPSHIVIVALSPGYGGWDSKNDQSSVYIIETNDRIYIDGLWGNVGDTLIVKNSWIKDMSLGNSWGKRDPRN